MSQSTLTEETTAPDSPPHRARYDKHGRRVPLAVAHRGCSALYPENTMLAFKAAVDAGADAIETDVHLSKDNVVVLTHDRTPKRCFGEEGKILDYKWDQLKTFRTVKEPHEGMPRLLDLLEYLASPALDRVWLLLDIKIDNNPDDIMRLIAETIEQIPTDATPWTERIVLGCWAAEYLPIRDKYLPGFPIMHIGFDILYARQFFKVPNVSFNILQRVLIGSAGDRFLDDARAAERPVFVWTVNQVSMMRWSIRKRVDGVLTDDVGKYIKVCDEFDNKYTEKDRLSLGVYLGTVGIQILVLCLGIVFRWRYGFKFDLIKGRIPHERRKSI